MDSQYHLSVVISSLAGRIGQITSSSLRLLHISYMNGKIANKKSKDFLYTGIFTMD